MTRLKLAAADPATTKVDALLIAIGKGADGPVLSPGATAVDRALGGRLAATLATLGATGKEGEVTRLPTLGALRAATIAAVGLGPVPSAGAAYPAEALRRAAGAGTRALAGAATAATTLASANDPAPDPATLRAVAEGALLGAYRFDRYRSPSAAGAKPPVEEVTILGAEPKDRAAQTVLARAEALTRAVTLARDLVNTAPGDLHPADLAAAAQAACAKTGLNVEVLDEKALDKAGYGGILGVGAGSAHPPRLIRVAYSHRKARRTVALVGKGVTFDSGGLSLKPAAAMESMKSDMAGAAAVIATMTAVAALAPQVNVIGYAPAAENMPSGSAIRPSDVLTLYGGKRVEVLNTDAEGRLLLGDAIARASEDAPDVIVDVATLTGAQLVALGARTAGVMANDDALRARVVEAAARSGESVWPMPLPPELRASLDSDVADLKNIGDRNGGMLVAGLFLQEFVGADIGWAHLDIAGPAFNTGDPHGYTPKGGTGAAVRTLVEFVEAVAAEA